MRGSAYPKVGVSAKEKLFLALAVPVRIRTYVQFSDHEYACYLANEAVVCDLKCRSFPTWRCCSVCRCRVRLAGNGLAAQRKILSFSSMRQGSCLTSSEPPSMIRSCGCQRSLLRCKIPGSRAQLSVSGSATTSSTTGTILQRRTWKTTCRSTSSPEQVSFPFLE